LGVCTLVQLKFGDSLPLVRRNEPFVVFPSARKINDEFGFIVANGLKDGLQAVHGKGRRGKEVRRYDHLLRFD
jgi:hypothetical protein